MSLAPSRRGGPRGRAPEPNENDLTTPLDPLPLHPPRSPLISIQDPSRNPRDEPGSTRTDSNASDLKKSSAVTPRSVQTASARASPRVSNVHDAHTTQHRGCSSRVYGAVTDAKSLVPVEVPYIELNEDPSFWKDHNVQVLIRIRPISGVEIAVQGYRRCLVQESSQTLTWAGHPETRFTFDHIACESMSQEKLFKVVGLPMVENCMSGYNSCMFAYGQTGSGKTHTMMGEIRETDSGLTEDRGMTPRIFEYLFTRIREEEEIRSAEKLKYSCKCSFLEIYNEQITDLLEPSSTNLQLREDINKGVYVENLKEYEVSSVKDVFELLLQGAANRKIAATHMNSESSRSHSVFTCIIESRWEKDSMTHLRFGRLNLVDLAGSERQKSSGAEGGRLKEAANINRSLSTLGLVIMTLVEIANGRHRHVPYRDSRLTFLLQDSLGGNSKTTIIANVSPSICSASETLSTLKFAQRAKLIQNNAKVNEDASGDVMELQQQIQKLKDQLTLLSKHQNVPMFLCYPSDNLEEANSVDLGNASNSSLGDNPNNNPCPLNQKINYLEATLIDSLRREKVAEAKLRRLEAEIRHMNLLVHQREDDAQQMNAMLRIRDEKLKRLELLADDLISSDGYLMEENAALSEEIQLLRERIDRKPELMQFALENMRLLEQVRMFQDFYQQGEREKLLNDISHLRNQFLKILVANFEVASRGATQTDDTIGELDSCRRQLGACVEYNARLARERDDLCCQLKYYQSAQQTTILNVGETPKNDHRYQETDKLSSVDLNFVGGDFEDEVTSHEQVDMISHIKTDQWIGDIVPLHCKVHDETKCQDAAKLNLDATLERMHRDLEEAKILNRHLEDDHALQLTCQHERRHVQEQVEAEAAETIMYFQEELAKLQEEVNLVNVSQLSATEESVLWKTKYEELGNRLSFLGQENVRLSNLIAAKDAVISVLSDDWEKAIIELTSFLIDGWRSLEDASECIGCVVDSFPQGNGWVNVHVERAIKVFIEREKLVANLQKSLEDAQEMAMEMKSKLDALKGATLAITEGHQLESDETSNEVFHLNRVLAEKVSRVQELENIVKNMNDDLIEAEQSAKTGYKVVRKLCDMSSAESFDLGVIKSEINELVNKNPLVIWECDSPRFKTQYCQSKDVEVNVRVVLPIPVEGNSVGTEERNAAEVPMELHASCTHLSDKLPMMELCQRLQTLEERLKEADTNYSKTEQILSDKLSYARQDAHEKTKLANDLFLKFEEVQQTMEEAEFVLNALLKANEDAKDERDWCKLASEELLAEKIALTEEVQHLEASNLSVARRFESLQEQIHTSLIDILSLIPSQQVMGEEANFNFSDIVSLGHELIQCIRTSRSWLEDVVSDVLGKDIELFVLHQCLIDVNYKEVISSHVQYELAIKTAQIDNILVEQKVLEASLSETEAALHSSRSEMEQAQKELIILSNENTELRLLLEDKRKVIESPVEGIMDELRRVSNERDNLLSEIVYLNDQLEMASALADENEAIAVEARQVAEASKISAEEKEEEVKILERSVEALEDTINILERKVIDMKDEVESYQLIRKGLELEVQALTRRISTVENTADIFNPEEDSYFKGGKSQMPRQLDDRDIDLCQARKHIEDLETERSYIAGEIKQYREHISELVLHSEAQSSLYQEKFKALESMISEVKSDSSISNPTGSVANTTEKNSMRARGSSSPFKCIASLVQQVNSEKDHELSVARLQIEELEALAANRQKEVCMLMARLAAVDSMTHDVIRDLLGVKLDMTNYANMIDGEQFQMLVEKNQEQSEEWNVKEKEIRDLKKEINNLLEERDSWIEEINQRKAETLASQVTLERLKQRDQLLTAQNEFLKIDKGNLRRKIAELDEKAKLLVEPQIRYNQMQSLKFKENIHQSVGTDELSRRLAQADKLLSRAKR